jgi:hypothetical protein
MSAAEFAELAAQLAPAQAAQAAQRRFEQRGGQRRRAPGAGSTGLLTPADRVLVTVVYSRRICSQNVLSDLLGINPNSIGEAIAETRQLLAEHGRTIAPTTLRFPTTDALTRFVSGDTEEPARPRLAERLADPALTGMSSSDLAALTERIVPILVARRTTPPPPPRRRTPTRRPRRHLHAEDHRRRTGTGHGALPARPGHP